MVNTLQEWASSDVGDPPAPPAPALPASPVEVSAGRQVDRPAHRAQELTGDGNVRGTGEFTDWHVQAVYRAIGYLSAHLADIQFDHDVGTIPNDGGRVLDLDEAHARHLRHRLDQARPGRPHRPHQGRRPGDHHQPARGRRHAAARRLPRRPTRSCSSSSSAACRSTNEGWRKLDAHEIALGAAEGRERVKVVTRDEMTGISNG